jgi:hypothetical protein
MSQPGRPEGSHRRVAHADDPMNMQTRQARPREARR